MTVGYFVPLLFFFFQKGNLDWILLKPEAGLILGKQGHFPFLDEKRLVSVMSVMSRFCDLQTRVLYVVVRAVDCFTRVTPVQNLNPIAVVCERKWREKSWVRISPDFKPVHRTSPLISCGQK